MGTFNMLLVKSKRYWKWIALLGFSVFLKTASQWQIEIALICALSNKNFDFPFYILPSINPYLARDIFYALSWIAFILFGYSVAKIIKCTKHLNSISNSN